MRLFFTLLLSSLSIFCMGQTYFTTGGLRMGSDFGLSLKQRISKKTTIESILYSDDNGKTNLGLALLLDKHRSILTRNFNLFYGAGLAWRWENELQEESYVKSSSMGIPLQAGIEFTVGRINLSWDYTPILYISTNSNSFSASKALTVRYVFISKKEGKRMMKKFKTPFSKRK